MRILVDMDEVLCKFTSRIIEWYNADKRMEHENQGLEPWKNVSLSDISSWDIKINLGPESEIYIRSYMRYPLFFQELEPIEDAIEGMNKLLKDGHDVIVVTNVAKCAGLAYEGKKEWLRKHIPAFPLDNLIAAKRKELVTGDILLDDGEHNLRAWSSFAPGRIAVAMKRPWNKEWCSEKDYNKYSVSTWKEFISFVETTEIVRQANEQEEIVF